MTSELVYLVQGGECYKIGRTKNLAKRLRVIQTNHAWILKVIRTWETPESVLLEKYLHRRFSGVKMHGEWFALSQEDVVSLQSVESWPLEVINPPKVKLVKLQKPRNYPLPQLKPSPFGESLRQYGISRPIELSAKAGLSRQYAHLLWTGKRLISRKMAKRLSPLLKVSPETLMMLEAPEQNDDDARN